MRERKRCGTCMYWQTTCTVPPFNTYCDVLGDGSVLVKQPGERHVCTRWASLAKHIRTLQGVNRL